MAFSRTRKCGESLLKSEIPHPAIYMLNQVQPCERHIKQAASFVSSYPNKLLMGQKLPNGWSPYFGMKNLSFNIQGLQQYGGLLGQNQPNKYPFRGWNNPPMVSSLLNANLGCSLGYHCRVFTHSQINKPNKTKKALQTNCLVIAAGSESSLPVPSIQLWPWATSESRASNQSIQLVGLQRYLCGSYCAGPAAKKQKHAIYCMYDKGIECCESVQNRLLILQHVSW